MKTKRTYGRGVAILLVAVLAALAGAVSARGQTSVSPLGSAEIRVVGASLTITAPTSVPLGAPIEIATALRAGAGSSAGTPAPLGMFGTAPLFVHGRLSGQGLATPIELDPVVPGQPLIVPPLTKVGPYVIDNLRLVRCTDGAACATPETILPATPSVVPFTAIDKIFVTNVSTRPLSLEEMRDRGIIIDAANFTTYEFTFGLATESGRVAIPFDVTFPKGADDVRDGGGMPPVAPGLNVPAFDVQGFIFKAPIDLDGIEIPPIPGIIVIPGNIAFLHQFFQVQVLVSNVTPAGSQLVITSAAASLELPVGDNAVLEVDDPSGDDPLWPARTANPPVDDPLCAAPLQDERLCSELHRINGAPDGSPVPLNSVPPSATSGERSVGPGEQGQGETVVEGRRVGTHRLKVTINAELHLPGASQPIPLTGIAYGTVLVRDPEFSLTINHPDVVRAGETYSLFVTVRNISGLTRTPDMPQGTLPSPANCATLSLDAAQISGATLSKT